MTHIRVEANDTLIFKENQIYAHVNNNEFIFSVEAVEKMVLITTDLGPFYDDMGLAIDVGDDTAVFIMSEHRCFKEFLFEQIGNTLPIDYQKVIDASMCTENNLFIIYHK